MSATHNSRLAESCRDDPLAFTDSESKISVQNQDKTDPIACEKDIFIGVFFDGTNNNKYRDAPGYGHSNVARLYEVFPGTAARQTIPTLPPRLDLAPSATAANRHVDSAEQDPGYVSRPRETQAELPPFSGTIPPEDLPYYRKIYVPGVGTPHPDIGDDGLGYRKTGGLAFALLGQARMDWATLQLINQVHAAVFNGPLQSTIQLNGVERSKNIDELLGVPLEWRAGLMSMISLINPALVLIPKVTAALADKLAPLSSIVADSVGIYRPDAFEAQIKSLHTRLTDALKQRKASNRTPGIRKLRLSVFGFSRGAAEARAWVNLVLQRFPQGVGGIPLQIDFLGLFDTVASVGMAQSFPHADGHSSWAAKDGMVVPDAVRRCVHLVSAHEVRGSFPLDSILQGGVRPPNCKEIVYPGVHSDVGGGYPLNDQGRALGVGVVANARKLSQIPLAQMYREARMAGVPLAPPEAMQPFQKDDFAIDPILKTDFNAYIAATRLATIPPTDGKGDPEYARMFPSETQPSENLQALVFRHAAYMLQWRRTFFTDGKGGGIYKLPCMYQYSSETRLQDVEDIRGAEDELRKEVVFLKSKDKKKFMEIDESPPLNFFFNLAHAIPDRLQPDVDDYDNQRFKKSAFVAMLGGIVPAIVFGFMELFGNKQKQWDLDWSRVWDGENLLSSASAADVGKFYASYVHDSRAWFKPLFRNDKKFSLAPDDEQWFVLGDRLKEQQELISDAVAERASKARWGDQGGVALANRKLQQAEAEGTPLVLGGREPYRAWGYLRHRTIYETGVYARASEAMKLESLAQVQARERQHQAMIEAENKSYADEIARRNENDRQANARIAKTEDYAEYAAIERNTRANLAKKHQEALARIDALFK